MNTKTTTTAPRFAIASNGKKFELPAFFPTASQREAMRQELATHPTDAMIRLIGHTEDLLKNGDAVDGAELAQIWDNAEREYFEATGHEWTFDVAETQHEEKAQNIPAQPAKVEENDIDGYDPCDEMDGYDPCDEMDRYEAEFEDRTQNATHKKEAQNIPAQPAKVEIPGLHKNAELGLLSYIERHPFQMIRAEAYSAAFLGACSSRRAGLNWHIWANRMTSAGMNPSVVAHIVLKAYRMPSSELIGFRR